MHCHRYYRYSVIHCHRYSPLFEDLEELVVERLGVHAFVVLAMPIPGEGGGAAADLVPGKAHIHTSG